MKQYSINKITFSLILLIAIFSCTNNHGRYIREVATKNIQIDSIINFALKEEMPFCRDSICGLIRFSKLRGVFQVEMVITEKQSIRYIDHEFFPQYYFRYKNFDVFVINKNVDDEFFEKTKNRKLFKYPKIKQRSKPSFMTKKPPLPPSSFEPTAYYFYYVEGTIIYHGSDTFMFEHFKDI
ncbi:MAG: hypothetical protein ABFD75_12785 [Smithella sp.]